MTSDFAELHDELRTVARDLLAKQGSQAVPGAGGSEGGRGGGDVPTLPAATDWSLLARSGWLGLEVPEELDGAGATFAEVAVILEEMGRAATPSPYLGTAVLGVGTLNLLEPNPGRDALLGLVAAGERKLAVALTPGGDGHHDAAARGPAPAPVGGGDGRPEADGGQAARAVTARAGGAAVGDRSPGAAPFRLERAAGRVRLSGRAAFVADAPDADRLVVLADDPDADGPVVVVVHAPPETTLEVTEQPVLDATRRLGTVVADGVEVTEAGVWRFRDDPTVAVRRVLDRASVALACDSLGVSQAMLDATVAYAGIRQQFGRPIGSFQAVKHACADMLVTISVARELVDAAVQALVAAAAADDADADADVTGDHDRDASTATSMAKSYACAGAVDVVGKALQLHGGIGYTWEDGIHTFLKRAALNRSLFGSPRAHRAQLAQRYTAPA